MRTAFILFVRGTDLTLDEMRECYFDCADGIATRVRGAKTQQSGKTYSRASGAALDNTDTQHTREHKHHRDR